MKPKKIVKTKLRMRKCKHFEEKYVHSGEELLSEKSESVSSFENKSYFDAHYGEDKILLDRTQLFIEEHKQFLAARTIQKYFLGWYHRKIFLRKRAAAIKIQSFWRGYYLRANFVKYLEKELEKRMWAYYHKMATRIQAFWRGWLVRLHVHDYYRLKRLEMRTAKELLFCVAYKMHYLIRTYNIPGIYSLKNSHAYSKIEQLMKVMKFQNIDCHSTDKIKEKTKKVISETTQISSQSDVPFKKEICSEKCKEFCRKKDVDIRMHRILLYYRDYMKTDPRVLAIKRKQLGKKDPKKIVEDKPNFCEDIIKSMSRWRVLGPRSAEINPNLLKDPENLNKFLKEVSKISECFSKKPCCCKLPPQPIKLHGDKLDAEKLQDIKLQALKIRDIKLRALKLSNFEKC